MRTYIVDSFTTEAFKGNPAGVCLLDTEITPQLMLCIAQELALSETAFIISLDSPSHYSIRYFSPKMEIPLCGHATLAAAQIVFANHAESEIHFFNIQQLDLCVARDGAEIIMEFPSYDTVAAAAPPQLLAALGVQSIVNCEYNAETKILLVEIAEDIVLRNLTPDFPALAKSHDSINGVLVTAPSSDKNFDFQSRYFWPWSGTNEDPVTGGTHTFLTKYWSKRLQKTKMRSFQCSHRTGTMQVELLSDSKMTIRGQAVVIFEGQLRI